MDKKMQDALDDLKGSLVVVRKLAVQEVSKANNKVMKEGTEKEKEYIKGMNERVNTALKTGDVNEAHKIIADLKNILNGNPDNSK